MTASHGGEIHPFAREAAAFARRHALLSPDSRVAVALSGGPDSCALLLALCEAADAGLLPCGRPVGAIHFHHGVRGVDADDEAAFAADLTAVRLGVPCVIGLGAVPTRDSGSGGGGATYSNDDARRARYAFLAEAAADLGADTLATAHTADDQAETVLLRVLRGTGVEGLGGIPRRRDLGDGLAVVRPLLGQTRAEVEAYCAARGVTPRRDPSNEKERYPRARLRKRLPDLARDFNPRLTDALGRLADNAASDADLLATLADDLWRRADRSAASDRVTLDAAPLLAAHPALRRRALLRAIRRATQPLGTDAEAATGAFVAALEEILLRGAGAVTLPGDVCARLRDGRLTFGKDRSPILPDPALLPFTPPRLLPVSYEVPLPLPGRADLPVVGQAITARRLLPGEPPARERRGNAVDIAAEAARGTIGDGGGPVLLVRDARLGDRIAPLGMGGKTRPLRDLMAEAKWPPERRENAPVVVRADAPNEILWAVGLAQTEATRVGPETTVVWRLSAEIR